MWKNWNLYVLLGGMLNGADTLVNNLSVTQTVKHTVII